MWNSVERPYRITYENESGKKGVYYVTARNRLDALSDFRLRVGHEKESVVRVEMRDGNGCFFCPNAGMNELRHLHRYHPELWQKLMDCQKAENKATELFNRSYRIDELDELFRAEETQLSLLEDATPLAA